MDTAQRGGYHSAAMRITVFLALSLLACDAAIDTRAETLTRCGGATDDRRVFVAGTTEAALQLSVGELADADADRICDDLAGKAGLSGSFRAYLSTEKLGAAERLQPGPGRYVLVSGDVIADSWAEFISAQHHIPINMTQHGDVIQSEIWTGTLPGGMPGSTCESWSQSAALATYGRTTVTGPDWTMHTETGTCDVERGLYCVEVDAPADIVSCDAACQAANADAAVESFYTDCGSPGSCDRCYNLLTDGQHFEVCSELCTVGDASTCPHSANYAAECRSYIGGGACVIKCGVNDACPDGMACAASLSGKACLWQQ